MNKELKPCPFCGGEVKLQRNIYDDGDSFWIECSDIWCPVFTTTVGCGTAEEAIKIWNTRNGVVDEVNNDNKGE